ncbi:iron complex transport system permease protein [Pseudoclavibacter chungangensis]|uniref:FecCD family ABC transporter permease n=1 Tax=Pseudoclavibacter chungangensis TaxID=587635 RepID=UPI0017B7AF47|nr:iron chelate uptake ABC transporter family permease subunit [Pseudoclavibacter chungangensis]NYJ65267.1 iron complex transport system permease protein [Pseudoclavibacter chungangensis]
MSERVLVLRLGPLSRRFGLRATLVHIVLALLAVATIVVALTIGRGGLPLGSILYAMRPEASDTIRLVFEWRAARALAAVLFGACLGMGGAVFQTLTRNPLGSPDVVGLGAGSFAGVVAVLMLGGSGFAALAFGSIAGGFAAVVIIYLLAYRRGVQGFRFIIIGIAVSAMLSALTIWFSVKAELDVAMQAAIWGAGTLTGVQWGLLGAVAIAALVGALALPTVGLVLPQFALGDEAASSLGLRVEPTKVLLVVVGVWFTAIVTAVSGPIGFIALAAPQLARRLTGGRTGIGLAGSALVGAVLLATADLAAQYLVPGMKLPVGAVTAIIGGGYLVWLLFRESARR